MKYLLTSLASFCMMISVLLLIPHCGEREIPLMRRIFPSRAIATGWRERYANFRLTVLHDRSDQPGFLDLRTLCIPGKIENGIRIYRESDWKPVSFHQYDAFHALVPPSDKPVRYEIYYDFLFPQGRRRWNPKKRKFPPLFNLRQHNVRIKIPPSPLKMAEYESRKQFNPFSRTRRVLWREIGHLMTAQVRLFSSLRNIPLTEKHLKNISSKEYENAGKKLSSALNAYRTASRDYMNDLFFSPFRRKSSGKNIPRIFFTTRPFDTDRTFLTCFKGGLIIPEDGTYEFRLNTNSTRILLIDGREVYRKTGVFKSSDSAFIGSTDILSLDLRKGTVFLEFIYYKEQSATWASLSWRKKGDPNFRLLSSDDFAPALPLVPLKLEDYGKRRYPLIHRDDSFAIYTSKDDPYSMDRFTMLSPDVFSWNWELDGSTVSSDFKFLLLHPGKSILKFRPDTRSGYTGFSIPLRKRGGEQIPVKPDISMKFRIPHFLYDDGSCTLSLEISSSIPAEYSLRFTGKISPENPCLNSFDKILTVPSMPMEGENRYAQSVVLKWDHPLDCSKLNGIGLTADYAVSIPPQEFDRKKFLIAPVSSLPELTTNSEGLCDREGRKVVPLLHRMSLHEVRSWELLRRVESKFHQAKKILVIAEDFGDLRKELEKCLKKQDIELEFIPWQKRMTPSGSAAVETIPAIMRHLKHSDADAAILIPPGTVRHGIIGPDAEFHAVAMITELLLNKESIHSVILASPFPFSPDEEKSLGKDEDAFCENLRKLRREKGIRFLELNAILRKHPLRTPESYQQNGIFSPFPLGLARYSAEVIVSEIVRK